MKKLLLSLSLLISFWAGGAWGGVFDGPFGPPFFTIFGNRSDVIRLETGAFIQMENSGYILLER